MHLLTLAESNDAVRLQDAMPIREDATLFARALRAEDGAIAEFIDRAFSVDHADDIEPLMTAARWLIATHPSCAELRTEL